MWVCWVVGGRMAYFLLCKDSGRRGGAVGNLARDPQASRVFLLASRPRSGSVPARGYRLLPSFSFRRARNVQRVLTLAHAPCLLVCAGPRALSVNCVTLRHVYSCLTTPRSKVICTSRCRIARKMQGPRPIVSCRPKDIHSSFSFNSILLFGATTLRRTFSAVARRPRCRCSTLCTIQLTLSRGCRLARVHRFLCARVRRSAHLSNRGRFSCMSPHGQDMRLRQRATFACYLGGVRTFLPPIRHGVSLSRNRFTCRTSIVVPMHGHVHAVTSTVRSMLGRRASFPFGLVIVSGRSASNAARYVSRCTKGRGIVRLVPRHSSLNVNKY